MTSTYVMTPAHFADGCFTRWINGRSYGTGETVFGAKVTLPLNVPLCTTCDQPADECECLTEVTVRDLGNGRYRGEAA